MGLLICNVRSASKKQPPSGQALNGKALVSFLPTYGFFISEASLLPSPLRFSHQRLPSSICMFWALPVHLGSVFPSCLLTRPVLMLSLALVLSNKFLWICFYSLSVTSSYLHYLLILVKYWGSKLISSWKLESSMLIGGRENEDEKWVWQYQQVPEAAIVSNSSFFPRNLLSGSVRQVAAQFPVLQEHGRPALASSIKQLSNWRNELHVIQFPAPASWWTLINILYLLSQPVHNTCISISMQLSFLSRNIPQ